MGRIRGIVRPQVAVGGGQVATAHEHIAEVLGRTDIHIVQALNLSQRSHVTEIVPGIHNLDAAERTVDVHLRHLRQHYICLVIFIYLGIPRRLL